MRRFSVLSGFFLCLAGFVLAACESGGQGTSNPYGLTAELEGDPSIERTWVEPEVEKITTLTSGKDYTLFNPATFWILKDERLYVWDAGDNRLKVFTPEGKYVTTYGKGAGSGPGEISVYRDIGLWNDSLYVLDPRNRKLSFFGPDGEFGRSEQYRRSIVNITWAGDSTKYELYVGPGTAPFIDLTASSGEHTSISDLLSRDVSSIVFDGQLFATRTHAVFVPLYFPVLLSFSPGDTIATAVPTPDYNDVPVPEPRTSGSDQQRSISPPSTQLHFEGALHDDVLSVQIATDEDSLAFDLYDARDMKYMRTARMPIPAGDSRYAYGVGIVAVERDTTVEVYEVQRSEKY